MNEHESQPATENKVREPSRIEQQFAHAWAARFEQALTQAVHDPTTTLDQLAQITVDGAYLDRLVPTRPSERNARKRCQCELLAFQRTDAELYRVLIARIQESFDLFQQQRSATLGSGSGPMVSVWAAINLAGRGGELGALDPADVYQAVLRDLAHRLKEAERSGES